MRHVLLSCGASIACVVAGARAEEPFWRAAPADRSTPPASLGAPRAVLGAPVAEPAPTQPVQRASATGDVIPVIPVQHFDPAAAVIDEGPLVPKQMPKAEVTEGKGGPPREQLPPARPVAPPVTAPDFGPALPGHTAEPPVDCQQPLFGPPGAAARGCHTSRWYGSAEYLLWWTHSMSTPVLLTTGPASTGGIIGQPGVTPLFGGTPINSGARSGARFELGYWFGECRNWGIDAGLFFLGDSGTRFAVSSSGDPLLARPFFAVNATTTPIQGLAIPGPLSEVIADPGITSGSAVIKTDSFLWGGELNALRRGWSCGPCSVNFLAGYRFMQLTEDLTITETFSGLSNTAFPAVAGVNGSITDRFRTANQFHGVNLGAIWQTQRGCWVFDMRTKIALGESLESADVSGGLAQSGPTFISPTVNGGLLALNSNSGHFTRTAFAVVPEIDLNVGYNLTRHCRLFMGYSCVYWSSVLRPGDQIDTRLDLNRIPIFTDPRLFPATTAIVPAGAPRPAPLLKDTDFWAQGLNFGVNFTW